MNRFAPVAIALAALVVPAAGHACSFAWVPGWSPEEIREREDVRKVRGTYRLLQVAGETFTAENGETWVRNAELRGRIETRRGTGWDTYHEPPDWELTCTVGTYFKPETDATGTFWISRRKVHGRYLILLWEGEYLPPEERGTPILGEIE